MKRQAKTIKLTDRQTNILNKMISSKKGERRLYQRASIIYGAYCGITNSALSKELHLKRETIAHWRGKWVDNSEKLEALEQEKDNKKYLEAITEILSDAPRPGTPPTFSAHQVCLIIALSCEAPEDSGYPVSHWGAALLRDEILKRKIVESISVTQVGRFLKSGRHTTP